jgi:hypothetical protein
MDAPACAVGTLEPHGGWVGFAPSPGGYALVVGGSGGVRRAPADADLLLALAIVYFEEALPPPPDELAATHADIAELVRHVAASEPDPSRHRELADAVDAVDDGLAPDVVISRVVTALRGRWVDDPVGRLVGRANELAGDD